VQLSFVQSSHIDVLPPTGDYAYWYANGNVWKMPKDGQYSSLLIPHDSYLNDFKVFQGK